MTQRSYVMRSLYKELYFFFVIINALLSRDIEHFKSHYILHTLVI